MYIAVLDEFPDYMTPTLVAHSVLGAHLQFARNYIAFSDKEENPYESYKFWLENDFRKCVVRVNQKEFDKISQLPDVYLGYENKTLQGKKSCAVVMPRAMQYNVLKFAKLWKPKENSNVME